MTAVRIPAQRRSARLVVTAGPSIGADEVRDLCPDAEVVPPIRFGDTYAYDLRAGDTLVVVDGFFWQCASVRHRELLDLIDRGVQVFGTSSMGALRAAELSELGMVGHGSVYDAYREGTIVGDDEVGMVHGLPEDGYVVAVDALVNIRATLVAARVGGLLTADQAGAVLAVAAGLGFTDRSWSTLLARAGVPAHTRAEVLRWVRTRVVDVKRADAAELLTRLAAGRLPEEGGSSVGGGRRPAPGQSGFSNTWEWHLRAHPDSATDVSPGDLLEAAAVIDRDHPAWRHRRLRRAIAALEVRARESHDEEPLVVRGRTPAIDDRADSLAQAQAAHREREATLHRHAGADEDLTDDELDALCVAHLRRHGVVEPEDDSLPDRVARRWLTEDELALPVAARTALVATRSTAADRNSQLPHALIEDLTKEGALDRLATSVVRVRAEFATAFPDYTGALSPSGRVVVEDLLADHWGGSFESQLHARGFRELPEIALMFALNDLYQSD